MNSSVYPRPKSQLQVPRTELLRREQRTKCVQEVTGWVRAVNQGPVKAATEDIFPSGTFASGIVPRTLDSGASPDPAAETGTYRQTGYQHKWEKRPSFECEVSHTLKKAVTLAREHVGAVYGIMANTGPSIARATVNALVDSVDGHGIAQSSLVPYIHSWVSSGSDLLAGGRMYMSYNYGRHPCTQRQEPRGGA